ncbi:Hypothetical predicted protein [Xyrichtys novacula]|uniref:Uncharacterized protein n=1 Tax=Xyrichtys novacula TaxID=13765 RepID=A0AAV1EXQ1_XYRNO|nr:Hypothetical predicted protein [Xyrichtys novacula]
MMPQQPDPSLTSHIPGHKAPSMASRTFGTTTIDLSDYEDREGNDTYRDMDENSDSEAEDSEEEEEDQLDAPFGDRQARFLSAELMRSRVEEELRQEVRDEMLSTMRDEMQRTIRGSTVNYTDDTDASEATMKQ